jgi:hypothetical protein
MTPTVNRVNAYEEFTPSRSFITVQCSQPLSRIMAEQLLRFLTPADVDPPDDYECWVPQALVFVELEPAETSPFMDC